MNMPPEILPGNNENKVPEPEKIPEEPAQNSSEGDESLNMPAMDMPVDIIFRQQLTAVYRDYIIMKDAFVESDKKKVSNTAKKVQLSLKAIDIHRNTWK